MSMMSPAAILDGVRLYLSLSGEGRRFCRRMWSVIRRARVPGAGELLRDRGERRLGTRNLRACDRAFQRFVPVHLTRRLKRDQAALYARYVGLARMNLAIRSRLFEAFDVAYDGAAEDRGALLAFYQREWNDLADRQHVPRAELLASLTGTDVAPRLALLRHLQDRLMELTPQETFPNYHGQVRAYLVAPRTDEAPEDPEAEVSRRAPIAALVATCVMVDHLPDDLLQAIRPFAIWLYCLDDFADVDDDRAAGRVTYISQADQPERRLRDLQRRAEDEIRRLAARPGRLLRLMRVMAEQVIAARRAGLNVEASYLGRD
jgi:hypothetical protein